MQVYTHISNTHTTTRREREISTNLLSLTSLSLHLPSYSPPHSLPQSPPHSPALKNAGLTRLRVAGQRFVGSEVVKRVVPCPALLTEVLEAGSTPTEQRSWVSVARVTDAVLEIGLYLDLGERQVCYRYGDWG